MFDDPKSLSSANWNDIHLWLTYFWIYVPLVLTFAFTMLTAHALIPSLINTGHIPSSVGRLRIPLTFFAALVFTGAVVMMVLTINKTLDLAKFWDRWLI